MNKIYWKDAMNALKGIDEDIEDGVPRKKRGRKPKGGKIIQHFLPINSKKENKPNIILHLKCSIKDLDILYYPTK